MHASDVSQQSDAVVHLSYSAEQVGFTSLQTSAPPSPDGWQ